jgi:hypothetical protein
MKRKRAGEPKPMGLQGDVIVDIETGRVLSLGEIEERSRGFGWSRAEIDSILEFAVRLRELGVAAERKPA